MSEQKREYAEYLGTKVFSNKKYRIRVKLFEHGLAVAEIDYKKRKALNGFFMLHFDDCKRECVFDTYDCLDYLSEDKVARRWFRRVLKPCFEKYLLPDGIVSSKLARIDEQEKWFHFYDFANEVDMAVFGRDEILKDPRYQNRNITFHTGEEDLSRLDFKKVHPIQSLPMLAIHCDYQLLYKLLQEVCPEFYQRLSKYGYDTIEDISFMCYFGEKDKKGNTYICHYAQVGVEYPKLAPCYVMPDISEDEEIIIKR